MILTSPCIFVSFGFAFHFLFFTLALKVLDDFINFAYVPRRFAISFRLLLVLNNVEEIPPRDGTHVSPQKFYLFRS